MNESLFFLALSFPLSNSLRLPTQATVLFLLDGTLEQALDTYFTNGHSCNEGVKEEPERERTVKYEREETT